MELSALSNVSKADIIKPGYFDSLGYATHKGKNQLVFLETRSFLPLILKNKNISSVITKKNFFHELPNNIGIAGVKNPREVFYKFHNYLVKETNFYWREFLSCISSEAKIGEGVIIAKNNVKIGKNAIIEAGAIILERSIIEDNVIIRAGSVVGSEGFQFISIKDSILPVLHGGGVLLHKNVEVQANSCIDKAVFGGFTELGEFTKLDNLVHIAHNVKIGKHCRIAASAMVAGSVTIGDNVWIGPASAVSSEITIGDRANITIGSVVTKSVEENQRVSGNFAISHEKFIKHIKNLNR